VRWRRDQSLRATWQRRPDLIEAARGRGWLSRIDEKFLTGLAQAGQVKESGG